MRKTPSYLKGLAETRARAAADAARLKKIQSELIIKLADAEAEIDSCDRLIRKFDSRLNPDLIKPIQAHKGRYGKHGELKHEIIRYLQQAAPNDVTTHEIGWFLVVQFGLEFITPQEQSRWQKNSATRELSRLADAGLVERVHALSMTNEVVGRWRWKSNVSLSLDHLREQAIHSDVSIQHSDEPPS